MVSYLKVERPTLEETVKAIREKRGYCIVCRAWTRENVEPDAKGYSCPKCYLHHVYGAEEVVLMGFTTG